MRMAQWRRRRWIAIGGATAAVAIGAWSAIALATPSGLVVTPSPTHLAPHLSWSEGDGTATGYNIGRAATCAGPFTTIASPVAPATSFDDTTLPTDGSADGTYCYQVTGLYPAGNTASGTAAVVFDTQKPVVTITSPAPGPVAGTVTITATASDATSQVNTIQLSIVGAAISIPVAHGTSATFTWNTKVLATNGASYTVTAVATDFAGNASAPATAAVTVDNTPPGAPGVSALQSPVAGSPTLTWLPVAGETYTVARDGTPLAGTVSPPWTDSATIAPGTYHYVVTAKDTAGNTTPSNDTTVVVIPPSVTAPRSLTALSPTNTVPHLTWQPPITFAVTSWEIYRDGAPLQAVDPALASFDDTTATQGPHTYSVQALNGMTGGDMSGSVSVTYDNVPPVLASANATANPDGSISITWPAATDPAPGSGVSSYVVRRAAGASAPNDAGSGTGVCTLTAPATGCMDTTAKSGTFYTYAVFAVDAAGNFARREASAKAIDTIAPDPVTGLKVVSSDRTYVRLGWNVPPLKGNDSDLAGFRVLLLRPGAKAPANPNDGTIVCRNDDPTDTLCDSLDLTTGKKVTYAVYAYDGVPNYSAPVLISAVPHSIDKTPPHKPTNVTLTHVGLVYTLKWVSPRDPDLSKFRVTLFPKTPAVRPSLGKAIVTGRVLHATFTLKAGQKVYVNLFAFDVTGNFSRVSQYIVAPVIQAKSKHKVTKKKGAKTPPKKTAAKTVKKKAPKLKLTGPKNKPVTVVIA